MNVRVLSEPLTLKLVDNEADLRMGRRIGVVDWDQQVVTNYQEHFENKFNVIVSYLTFRWKLSCTILQ